MTAATPSVSAPTAWQRWRLAIRPRTLPAAVAPVVVGLALAVRAEKGSPLLALLTVVVALLLQIAANLANDLSDFHRGADADRLGPPRVTQLGFVTPAAMTRAVALTLALATLLGLPLIVAGGWPIALAGLGSLVAALAYTGGPYPLAYHGLGEAAVAGFFGGVGVLGTLWLQTGAISGEAVAAAVALGALAAAILVVNNLRDRATDEAAGKRTLAVRLGDAGAVREYQALLVLAYALPVLVLLTGREHLAWLAVFVTAPRAVLLARRVAATRGRALNPLLGATAQLTLWYALALAGGLVLERWIG